jgi:hypothetical protein
MNITLCINEQVVHAVADGCCVIKQKLCYQLTLEQGQTLFLPCDSAFIINKEAAVAA